MSDTTETRVSHWFTPWRFGILLALFILATYPEVLLGVQTFVTRDFGFFAYPLASFQRLSFLHGTIPLWNPYNNCGIPFLAQWNTMPLYPPSLIYLLLPLRWSLSFFCLLHLWFAGFGMFFLARRWTSNSLGAAFAGTAFAFNGLTLNMLMWPSHIATLSWMPWVVLAVEQAWRMGGTKIILAAWIGAMQMLAGGPETIFLTWILLFALWLQQWITGGSDALSATTITTAPNQMRVTMFWRFPLVILLVIALSAAQLLPFLDLAAHSQRNLGYADARWSMPAWGWVNFLVPMSFGSVSNTGVFFQHGQAWTSSYYLGMGTLTLAMLALWRARDRRISMLAIAALIALLLAFGENSFLYRHLRTILPQLSLMTYPVKFVTLVAFVAPLLAAYALTRMQRLKPEEVRPFRARLVFGCATLLILIAGVVAWSRLFPFPEDQFSTTLISGLSRGFFLVLTGIILLIQMGSAGVRLKSVFPPLLIIVAWLDVLTHEPSQNPTVPSSVYQTGLAREKLGMNPQPAIGQSRAMITPGALYSFVHETVSSPQNNFLAKRLGYCANCNLLDAVPKVDGFFSLCPRASGDLNDLLYTAINADFPRLEDFMSVSQITAPGKVFDWTSRDTFMPMVTAGQKPVFLNDTDALAAISRNEFDGNQMVVITPEEKNLVTVTNQTHAQISDLSFGQQEVAFDVVADQPSMVVVSQSFYHAWQAAVDGMKSHLFRANDAFQAVQVPAGKHHVRLVYRDRAFQIGCLISGAAWVGCIGGLVRLKRRRLS